MLILAYCEFNVLDALYSSYAAEVEAVLGLHCELGSCELLGCAAAYLLLADSCRDELICHINGSDVLLAYLSLAVLSYNEVDGSRLCVSERSGILDECVLACGKL